MTTVGMLCFCNSYRDSFHKNTLNDFFKIYFYNIQPCTEYEKKIYPHAVNSVVMKIVSNLIGTVVLDEYDYIQGFCIYDNYGLSISTEEFTKIMNYNFKSLKFIDYWNLKKQPFLEIPLTK